MKRKLGPVRPAMTAIAAVIALSSTPLLAQTTDTGPAQSAPVVVAPPAPTVEPVAPPASAQVASPDVAAPAPAQAAPQPAMKTMSTPVEHSEDRSATSSLTSGAGTAAPARRATAAPVAAAHVQTRASAGTPRASASTAPVAAHVAPTAKTVAPAASHATPKPTATPASGPDVATSAPAPAARVTTTRTTTTRDETLPIAIGLGVIAIGAAGFALRRRKRDDGTDELLLGTPIEAPPVVAAEPATIAPRAAEPAPMAVAPATAAAAEGPSRLPNGFDLSRFGRHARAAYLGPTPDNPSHSLKRRLKRASFFDQREREAAAAGNMREPVYPESRAAQAAAADNGQVTVRMAPGRKPSNFGYVTQR